MCWPILMAEFHTIVLGLVMAVEFGAPRIIIESDSKGVVELISSRDPCLNEFGTFLQDVKELVSHVEVIFMFVPRECKRMALFVILFFLVLRRVRILCYHIS